MRVLLIEDNQAIRENLSAMIVGLGLEATCLPNGSSVERTCDEALPDIVITDIFMPETDGLETIARLRRHRPDIPVIAMTGGALGFHCSQVETWGRAYGVGFTLAKPFTRDELIEALVAARPGFDEILRSGRDFRRPHRSSGPEHRHGLQEGPRTDELVPTGM